MRELVTTFASFCLAETLYACQQVAKTLGAPAAFVDPKNEPAPGPDAKSQPTVTGKLYHRAKRTSDHFGDPAAAAFLAGDEQLSKSIDAFFNLVSSPRGFRPYWTSLPRLAVTQAGLAAATVGSQSALFKQQMENTRFIFTLVRNNQEEIGIPKTGEFDLDHFVGKAYGIGDFENIWTVEGLGHVYSQRTWLLKHNLSEDAQGILIEGQAASLPEKSLTMMHAGLGLAFAESLMKQLTLGSSTQEVERVLKSFIKLCTNNSRPGYVGCALESLGLVTRCFNYTMVGLVQQVLADVDPIAWEFFWRGAGRALYFSPLHMLQSVFSPWVTAEMEAPNEQAFRSLKAGISWATNVVNMRQPEIFEDLIRRRGAEEESEGTIRHGVAASTTMAMDITPNHPLVRAYLDYQPKSSDPKVRQLWAKLVHEPASRAVSRYQPILKKHNMLDQVFRFQDLDALVDRLEASDAGVKSQRAKKG